MDEAQTDLTQEKKYWDLVHPELSDFVTLRNFAEMAPTLIMPRFAHVRDDQHQDLGIVDAVNCEMENFADRGLVHSDLHWRHVGLYKDEKNILRAVFFDLGRVCTKQDKTVAVKEM